MTGFVFDLPYQHIRAISATPSRISQESMRQMTQTLSVESFLPSSAILQTPSAKFTIRDPEIPGIGPTLSVELMPLASLEI